uniref:DNA polymerase III subunit delta n=1 Tax=Gemmiger formicilis TaxID=745368 RepID=UPI004027558B
MLYSEKELEKRLKAGCALYYFYASDEALVHTAAQRTLKYLNRDDPETTVLDGPTPSVEEIVLAAGTISFFGGKRLVLMPLIRPSTYSDKDLQELCDTLADTENAIFVLTSIIEESYGKLRPGKREQKLIASCEKLGYCVQLNRPTGAALQAMARDWAKEAGADFAPGTEAALLARCGEDQFLLKNEVEKLAALANYSTITKEMVSRLGTVTLDADTFDMVKLLTSGQADKAQQKLKTLLALQNEPIMITGALISNYLDLYRVLLGRRSRRSLGDVAKDFGYKGNWNYRLNSTEKTALRFKRAQLEECLHILQRLDTDLKSSKLDADLLMQKALCELALAGRA